MKVGDTVFLQILIMFTIMAVGFVLYKVKWISTQTTKDMSVILLKVVSSSIIFNSFLISFSKTMLIDILITVVLSMLSLLIGIIVARIFFGNRHPIGSFAVVFSNVGFMGIPLVQSVLGDQYVIYISIYVACYNILLWSYGVWAISKGEAKITIKSIITNPNMIAILLGFICFLFSLSVPSVIQKALVSIGSINTPMAMIVLGVYLAQANLLDRLTDIRLYKVSLFRLFVVPIIVIVMMILVPNQYIHIKTVVLIAAATPCATATAMFAQLYDEDYTFAAKVVSLSTLFSAISIPIIMSLSSVIWKI